jgi:hypothetical protein
MNKTQPQVGDAIRVSWPGERELVEFPIGVIRPDKDGVMCAVFGRDGTIGAEAVEDLVWDEERKAWIKQ